MGAKVHPGDVTMVGTALVVAIMLFWVVSHPAGTSPDEAPSNVTGAAVGHHARVGLGDDSPDDILPANEEEPELRELRSEEATGKAGPAAPKPRGVPKQKASVPR